MAGIGTHLMVAAIDFGTAYSGYAFSMRHDFDKDPSNISAVPWNSSRALQSLKAPSCVLFDPNKKFHSFGFEAEDKYADLAFDEVHKDWYFFKQFKMKLYDKMTLKRNFCIEDERGKSLPAIDVFSAAIGYLRDHLLETCRKRFPDTKASDIRWILTVPAIWDEAAKKFMREAAEKVGIAGDKLMLCLEPEAASLYCRSLKVDKLVDSSDGGLSPFRPGSKYIVLDAGGGTVDITVHEVKPDGTLGELYRASGGNWGGTYVDKAFLKLLADIIGQTILDQCKENAMIDMLDLLREFEVKKRSFKPDMDDRIMFKVPVKLNEAFKEKTGKDIKDSLSSTKYASKIRWIGDKLRAEQAIVKGLFADVNNGIVLHLRKLFAEEPIRNVSSILMVGGFSESPMLQASIRQHFPDKRIIIPEDAGLAVLKGAVIFGHDPSAISERRCRYTYGFACNSAVASMKIKEESIPANRKYYDNNGTLRVRDKFDKHVIIGQLMKTGTANPPQTYYSAEGGDFTLRLFSSIELDPMYVTDHSCSLIGSMEVAVAHLDDTDVVTSITFSGTEILVEAMKNETKEKLSAKFKLLD